MVIGIGWGYHVEILLRFFPERKIHFQEPLTEMLDLLRSEGRLKELEKAGLTLVESEPPGALTVVLPVYARFFPDLLEQKASVSSSTGRRFLRSWTRNFFRRLLTRGTFPYISELRNVSSLLYCGAGPSLQTDLEAHLPGEDIFIVCADTALPVLLSMRREPDLVISLDSGPGTLLHLEAAAKRIPAPFAFPLLTWTAGHFALEKFFTNVYFYRSTFPFEQMAEDSLKFVSEWTNPSLNAAGLAVRLTALAGQKTLYLAGADFTATGGRTHATGTGYDSYAGLLTERTHGFPQYRPGGYREDLTLKNKAARTGIESMARSDQIEIRKITDEKPVEKQNSSSGTHGARFVAVDVSAQHLRKSISSVWDRADFNEFSFLDESFLKKWRRKITSI